MLRVCLVLALVAVPLLALPGCKGGGSSLKGNVVLPPNMVQDGDSVTILFVPEQGGTSVLAPYQFSDSTFVCKSIPAGKYKVTAQLAAPGANAKRQAQFDAFNAKYSAEKTPLTYDTASGSDITIDLVAGTVKNK